MTFFTLRQLSEIRNVPILGNMGEVVMPLIMYDWSNISFDED
jgi:hypothetical protein